MNALLSLAYGMLAKDLTVTCHAVGFDPMLGFYHQPRHGCPALALDLMEPFRPLIGNSAALTASGQKGFLRAYELRMDTLITHPML